MIVTRTVCVFLMSHTFVESFIFYIYQTYLDREIKEKQNAKEIEANRDKIQESQSARYVSTVLL